MTQPLQVTDFGLNLPYVSLSFGIDWCKEALILKHRNNNNNNDDARLPHTILRKKDVVVLLQPDQKEEMDKDFAFIVNNLDNDHHTSVQVETATTITREFYSNDVGRIKECFRGLPKKANIYKTATSDGSSQGSFLINTDHLSREKLSLGYSLAIILRITMWSDEIYPSSPILEETGYFLRETHYTSGKIEPRYYEICIYVTTNESEFKWLPFERKIYGQ